MTDTLVRPEPPVADGLRVISPHARRRQRRSQLVAWILRVAMLFALFPLAYILFEVIRRGHGALSWGFLTQEEFPHRREGGGYAQGIVGTLYMVSLAGLAAIPTGIAAAIYLVEYGRGWLARIIRFFTDVMTGVPSIFVGLFVYVALVSQFRFGTLMGAIGLGIMMLPIVVRASEEMLKLVPEDQRAASAGLGARRYQTIMRVVLPTAGPGIVTGAMLAVARAAGETAVLLVTALGSLKIVTALTGTAQSSITLLIYAGAKQPFEPGKERAWAGALLLMALVFTLTFLARVITNRTRR